VNKELRFSAEYELENMRQKECLSVVNASELRCHLSVFIWEHQIVFSKMQDSSARVNAISDTDGVTRDFSIRARHATCHS
jgi:hypothetical protein